MCDVSNFNIDLNSIKETFKFSPDGKGLTHKQGNKYKLENNKPVPIKTSQEPVQTYGKHGNLNVDNDSSGGPFIKSGRLDLE